MTKFLSDTLVWRKGLSGWVEAKNILDINMLF